MLIVPREILLLTLFACVMVSASEPTKLTSAFDQIDAFVAQHMKERGTPGMALALTSTNRLLGQRAYGFADKERQLPVTDATLFQIGSITKSFTAIALLQQAEGGRLAVDAPVNRYLPWFKVHSDYAPIKVHHLLTHTAGIPSNRDDLPASPFMALALREQSVAWPPGNRFLYSNVGYQVLHVLLESVSGKAWAEVVGRSVFKPLGMNASEHAITDQIRARQAVGYVAPYSDRPHHPSRPLVRAPFFEYTIGDGCIAAIAEDMTKYIRMLLNRGRGPNGRILSEHSFGEFAKPWIETRGSTGYGYGIAIQDDGDLRLMHSGGMVGATAMMIANLTSGTGVIVMLNGPGDGRAIANFALEALNSALNDTDLPEIPPIRNRRHVKDAADYAGLFKSAVGGELHFVANDNRLELLDLKRTLTLESYGPGTFYTPDPAFDRHFIRFERNTVGKVVSVSHGSSWFAAKDSKHKDPAPVPAAWAGYVGRYVSNSPWFPGFTVYKRRDQLLVATEGGGESSAGDEMVLVPLEDGSFKPGEDVTPERIRFTDLVKGQSWSATWSGHRFYRDRLH